MMTTEDLDSFITDKFPGKIPQSMRIKIKYAIIKWDKMVREELAKQVDFETSIKNQDEFYFPIESFECFINEDEINKILLATCDFFNIPVELSLSKSRKREVVLTRQISMYFSYIKRKGSFELIGKTIGDKDHATVMHAFKTVKNLMDTDKKFAQMIDKIEREIVY